MANTHTTTEATLYNYLTGEAIRTATTAELAASVTAAESDSGAGVIEINGTAVYAA